jgi:hypothetical protein
MAGRLARGVAVLAIVLAGGLVGACATATDEDAGAEAVVDESEDETFSDEEDEAYDEDLEDADAVDEDDEIDLNEQCELGVPERPWFDDFYTQECSVLGISIVSSDNVDPLAFTAAAEMVVGMPDGRPDLHAHMAETGFYMILLGVEDHVNDAPEYADEVLDEGDDGRGMANDEYGVVGEENVLCAPDDGAYGESIFVHELAHGIYNNALLALDPEFEGRLTAAYDGALGAGKWADSYAATNVDEYWAEGVQDWFETNLEEDPPDGIHNLVNTREELRAYDQPLHDLIAEVFVTSWLYACPV